MSAGQNKGYWGPGRFKKKFEPNRKNIRVPNWRLCKTDNSTKNKKINLIGGGKYETTFVSYISPSNDFLMLISALQRR